MTEDRDDQRQEESRREVHARITSDPRVMGGKPCIRGMRVTVSMVQGLLAAGHGVGEILELYPYLEREDVDAVIAFTRSAEHAGSGQGGTPGSEVEGSAARAGQAVEASTESALSPEAQRVADAIRGLPEPEQELVLDRIIASIEEEGGDLDGQVERLWRGLAHLELSRSARRLDSEGASASARRTPLASPGEERPEAVGKLASDESLTFVVRSRDYPFLVEGTVDGLPFCLLEEGDRWRFAVSRDPAVDPGTIRSRREGFLVGGGIGLDRVRGQAPPMTDDQLLWLIEVSRLVLVRRVEAGRAQDAPGLLRARIEERRPPREVGPLDAELGGALDEAGREPGT